MELDLILAARRAVASISVPEEWLTLKDVISMTTPLGKCACVLNLPLKFVHRPDGTLRARLFGLQGGGLYISGWATLTNTNVYSNTADSVPAQLLNLPRRFLHCPAGVLTVAICVVWQTVSFAANRTRV